MLKFIQRYKLRLSLGFVLIFLLLSLLGQVGGNRQENWFSSLFQAATQPFLRFSDYMVDGVSGVWTGYIWLVGVKKENQQLTKQLLELQSQAAQGREVYKGYLRQRELLNFKQKNQDQKVFAEVVGEIQRGFSRLLILNKGSREGIKKNFAVVTPSGVVGKIQSVTDYQSVVQLITDPNSKFPVLVQQNRAKAMVQGSLDGTISITHFPRRIEIEQGGVVVTSGLAGILPKGFPVGLVSSVEKKEFGLFQTVTIEPLAELHNLEEVVVILYANQNIHHPLFTD